MGTHNGWDIFQHSAPMLYMKEFDRIWPFRFKQTVQLQGSSFKALVKKFTS